MANSIELGAEPLLVVIIGGIIIGVLFEKFIQVVSTTSFRQSEAGRALSESPILRILYGVVFIVWWGVMLVPEAESVRELQIITVLGGLALVGWDMLLGSIVAGARATFESIAKRAEAQREQLED